jgi:hypothetical protein
MPVNLGSLARLGSLAPQYLSTGSDEAAVQPVLFAGQQAQGADLNALRKAQSLAAQGTPTQQVYQQTMPQGTAQTVGRATNYIPSSRTGWFQGADGQWRFEFDDSKSKFNPEAFQKVQNFKDVKLNELLSHPELFKLYPEIANIKLSPLSLQEMDEGLKGDFDPTTNIMRLHSDPQEARQTLMHELQHWIQDKEGFSPGGSVDTAKIDLQTDVINKAKQDRENLQNTIMDLIKKNQFEKAENLQGSLINFPKQMDQALEDLNKRFGKLDDYDIYRRLSGETEARNVETRLPLTIQQRQKDLPFKTEEFPYSEQFVKEQ